jgi:hypothetical protein
MDVWGVVDFGRLGFRPLQVFKGEVMTVLYLCSGG